MSVNLTEIRTLLVPELTEETYRELSDKWDAVFAHHVETLPLKETLLLTTAAVIASNPVVSRRFLP